MTEPPSFSVFLWNERVHLANRVKQLRAEHGLSQAKLAEITLLHSNTINRLENPDMASVTLSTIARIAWAFDVPITLLLGGDDANQVSERAAGGGGANHPGLYPLRPDR